MTTITLPIYNTEGKEINTLKLDSSIFGDSVNEASIYQVVNAYRANQRQGLAQTKTRGEVSGGGRKPWKQKGTGRARVGSTRSPLWRHGGVIFGPHPRDFSYTVPKKIKSLALKSAIYVKIKENNLIILDNFKVENSKTKEAVKMFSSLKINPSGRALLLVDKIDANLKLALRNIGFLTVNRASDTNTYEVLAHKKLIITESAVKVLIERSKKK
jgi:large subunit ribosomal protein L4